MPSGTETLVQYGAIGVILTVLLTLFVWVFRLLVNRLIQHLDNFEKFMVEQIKALQRIEANIDENHNELIQRIRAPGR